MFKAAASSLTESLRAGLVRWRALSALTRDGVCTAALAPVVFAPGTAGIGAEFGDLPQRPPDALSVLLAVALWLPLLVSRRWPRVCLAIVASAFALHELLGYPGTFATTGLYVVLYCAGAHLQGSRRMPTIAAATGAYVLFTVALHVRGSPQLLPDFLTIYVILAVCWGAGAWVRTRQVREAALRHQSVLAAKAQERARIARELHDVVTHHVTAMVVQADAATFVLADAPDQAATGLTAIGDSGRRALTDLQQLLGLLNASGEAEPHAADQPLAAARLIDLVEETRSAGQPVELTEEGVRQPASGGVELAAYRVVQEALTNALKYALGRQTAVRIRYGPDETDIEVTTEGPDATGSGPARGPFGRGGPGGGPGGGSRGLAGLRERVSVLGGELLTEERPDGGFVVHARIPSGNGR